MSVFAFTKSDIYVIVTTESIPQLMDY